jgi:hypothetical protein
MLTFLQRKATSMTRTWTLRVGIAVTSIFVVTGLTDCASQSATTDLSNCAPSTETCDGKDNDCDGKVDEDADGNAIVSSCTSSGKDGVKTCAGGTWGECKVTCTAKAEECNGLDDDCNGKTDDDGKGNQMSASCTASNGLTGTKYCSAGVWGPCASDCTPQAEECDGKDNDCDGKTDEDDKGEPLVTTCTASNNIAGSKICANGKWGDCKSNCSPKAEECNGVDDDCDGKIDEDDTGKPLSRGCTNKCGNGTEVCASGAFANCTAPQPKTEECNGLDDDCDGKVDNGFDCAKASIQNCGTDVGECEFGTQVCNASCKWDECKGQVKPTAEVCEGAKDEDCNGTIDNGCTCKNGDTQDCCGGTKIACAIGAWPTCPAAPTETCNHVDDDCNGKIDDNLPAATYMPEEMASGADDCQTNFKTLPNVVEGTGATKLSYHLYRSDLSADRDFFFFTAAENDDLSCFVNPSYYECYELKVQLTKKPTGSSYRFCVYDMDFAGTNTTCATPVKKTCSTASSDTVSIKWQGDCGFTDNRDFFIEVYAENGTANSCDPYEITVEVPTNSPQAATCN